MSQAGADPASFCFFEMRLQPWRAGIARRNSEYGGQRPPPYFMPARRQSHAGSFILRVTENRKPPSGLLFHLITRVPQGGQHRLAVFRAPGLQVEFHPGVVQGQFPGQAVVEQVEDVGPLLP